MRPCSTGRRRALAAALLALAAACTNHAPLADTNAPLTAGAIDFVEPRTIDLGAAPNAIVVADLDGDGRPDLAAATGSNGVAVALARDGGFAPARAYAAGDASGLVAGDFDRDGKIDLAVMNEGGVGVILGKGDGSFGAPRSFAAGHAPAAMVAGDFDRDGRIDLAVLDSAVGYVNVLIGNGDGTFQRAQPYAAIPGARWLVAGDLDGDGKLDLLVVTGTGRVAPLFGKGDGTFRIVPVGALGGIEGIPALTSGDFDGDGKLDLAITQNVDHVGSVRIALGNGNGTFRWAGGIPGEWRLGTRAIVSGDLDGDGKLDIIAGVDRGRVVLTALGKGDGTLGARAYHSAAGNVLWAADVDGDGKADVISPTEKGVTVLASNGDGTLRAPRAVEVSENGENAKRLVVGDFNRDGVPDVAVTTVGEGNGVQVLLGDGRGGLRAAATFNPGEFVGEAEIAAADLNGDGILDLVIAGEVRVLLGNGDGSFRHGYDNRRIAGWGIALGDFDGNGALDLALYWPGRPGITILPGKGDGGFDNDRVTTIEADRTILGAAAADLDGDGKPDLAVGTPGGLILLAGKGDGTFAPARSLDDAGPRSAVTAADLDGDGRIDLVVAHAGEEVSTVLLDTGGGTFRPAGSVPSSGRIRVGDVDGDGIPDILVHGDVLVVYRGKGDGTFEGARVFSGAGIDFALADLDRDGHPEVLVTRGSSKFVTVLPNASR